MPRSPLISSTVHCETELDPMKTLRIWTKRKEDLVRGFGAKSVPQFKIYYRTSIKFVNSIADTETGMSGHDFPCLSQGVLQVTVPVFILIFHPYTLLKRT